MNKKLFMKKMRKRLLASLLAVTLSVPAQGTSLLAAGIHSTDTEQAHYD